MASRKSITASLTELLLIAITFSIVFVFISYITIHVTNLTSSTQRLKVYGDAELIVNDNSETYAIVRIYADIKPAVVIEKMIIDKYKSINVSIVKILQGAPKVENGELVLPAGSYVIVRFEFPPEAGNAISAEYWGFVEGYILTHGGNVYKVTLKLIKNS